MKIQHSKTALLFSLLIFSILNVCNAGMISKPARTYDLNICIFSFKADGRYSASWKNTDDSQIKYGHCYNPDKTEGVACYLNGQCEKYTDPAGISYAFRRSVHELIFPPIPPKPVTSVPNPLVQPVVKVENAPAKLVPVAPLSTPKQKIVPRLPLNTAPQIIAPVRAKPKPTISTRSYSSPKAVLNPTLPPSQSLPKSKGSKPPYRTPAKKLSDKYIISK